MLDMGMLDMGMIDMGMLDMRMMFYYHDSNMFIACIVLYISCIISGSFFSGSFFGFFLVSLF